MTVREFLNNTNVSLDDEMMILIQITDGESDYIQHFPIENISKISDKNTIELNSKFLNKYINEFAE